MSNEKEMTKDEAYEKFPFLKKLDQSDLRELMVSVLIMILKGPKEQNTIMYALQAFFKPEN